LASFLAPGYPGRLRAIGRHTGRTHLSHHHRSPLASGWRTINHAKSIAINAHYKQREVIKRKRKCPSYFKP
jgi:hypothetical protein